MSKTDSERLTRMEDNQADFGRALDRIFKRLDRQDDMLRSLNQKFDELNGAKKLLWGAAATFAGIAGIIAAWLGSHR